jgi:hypothetical protein
MDSGAHLPDLVPRDANGPSASNLGRDASKEASSLPDRHANEDRHNTRPTFPNALELEIIDFAAAPSLRVQELMVEDPKPQVDFSRLAHPCPILLRTSSGIAAIAMIRTTMR